MQGLCGLFLCSELYSKVDSSLPKDADSAPVVHVDLDLDVVDPAPVVHVDSDLDVADPEFVVHVDSDLDEC